MQVKAKLLHRSKLVLNTGLVREIIIWSVPQNKYYPEGIKYRLILADPFWKKIIVLFDNHPPKGHHRHDFDGIEHNYHFISVRVLIRDFLKIESIEEKRYENNEN